MSSQQNGSRILIGIGLALGIVATVAAGMFAPPEVGIGVAVAVIVIASILALRPPPEPKDDGRIAAQIELERSRDLKRAIVASANCPIISTKITGTITHVNQAAAEMLGYEESELVGIKSL